MLLWLWRPICTLTNTVKSQNWNCWIKRYMHLWSWWKLPIATPDRGCRRALSLAICEKTCSLTSLPTVYYQSLGGCQFSRIKKKMLCIVLICFFLISEFKQLLIFYNGISFFLFYVLYSNVLPLFLLGLIFLIQLLKIIWKINPLSIFFPVNNLF